MPGVDPKGSRPDPSTTFPQSPASIICLSSGREDGFHWRNDVQGRVRGTIHGLHPGALGSCDLPWTMGFGYSHPAVPADRLYLRPEQGLR